MFLLLEDNPERIHRFTDVLRGIEPSLPLCVWRSAWAMLRDLDHSLPHARVVSLDHDLEPDEADSRDPGTGWDVAKVMAACRPTCPVIVHTSNGPRSDWMLGEFELGRWKCYRVAPLGDDWIERDWARTVRRLLRRSCPKRIPEVIIDALRPEDWNEVRTIYLEGIASGLSTFETTAPVWEAWDAGHLPGCRLAARTDGRLVGWAALSSVSRRGCYAGVAEVSIYVAGFARGQGVGRALLTAVIVESERLGIWTLQGSTFAGNTASLRLQESCGFRVVGRRERIASREGVWHDTILTERRSPVVGW